ncbi:magnesium and cobalt transport protein CorA [Psychrobacter sp. CCUG 69069]|uniref:CorA family divalent cation transporter n=1 Tax=Psychrobacter sp. CCUG 69069 TaxID=2282777 RepID=UPI001E539B75|nr:CorA family divalent cation transporter [Psychrobacter sp. CCUG 69069]MCD1279989.1 magnesium and cobalt transport protein CorA [Psychrobacter sp. CCUG 69069]
MSDEFLRNTTLIAYSPSTVSKVPCEDILILNFEPHGDEVFWLNTYGLRELDEMEQVVIQNQFDDFLIKLLQDDEHANKVIELDNVLFIALKVLKTDDKNLDNKQLIFVVSSNMLWSLQENHNNHFQWIRDRLSEGKGQVRSKKVDYLLFLLIESLIANYEETFESLLNADGDSIKVTNINPTPYSTKKVEEQKRRMLNFKKATLSLRNTIVKLETINIIPMDSKYFTELKEQANNLIDEIDFELFELDSKTNLIFSIQGHRLNEIIRTLTLVSVVFIPLTFLVGVYGMNFDYMPELKWNEGYFALWGVMVTLTVAIVVYFKSKKWF